MPSSSNERVLDGKYRLIRKLEEGGMGSVWFAEHLSLSSPVAVKLIVKEVAATQEGLQRFLREARTAASLRSPHVVQILDYGVDLGTPYIVMELLNGESLAARLKRVGQLGAAETELVLRQVARAVGLVHDAGVVHRDLKPANIFIIANDDEEIVKLLDFGIAKAAVNGPVDNSTRTGAFLGTPFYASPEQAEGIRGLDHRTDIWSMGVIAFECLLGRLPFTGDTFGSLVLAICSRPMPVPSQHGPVPAGFDEWFARACARNREQRFQSAREAARELRGILARAATDDAPLRLEPRGAPVFLPRHAPPAQARPAAGPSALPARAVLDAAPHAYLADTTAAASSSAVRERTALKLSRPMLTMGGLGALGALVAVFVLFGGGASKGVDGEMTHSAALSTPEPTPAARSATEPSTPPTGKPINPSQTQPDVQKAPEVTPLPSTAGSTSLEAQTRSEREAAQPVESKLSAPSVAPAAKRAARKSPRPQRARKSTAPAPPATAVQPESPKQGVDLGL